MPVSTIDKNKHLLLRAGFGPNLEQIPNLEKRTQKEIWAELLSKSSTFKPINLNSENVDVKVDAPMTAETKKELVQRSRRQNAELNLKFFSEMVKSEAQLREKLAFFWHGHFATRINNPKFNQQILNVIRENALGNFGDLLAAVSKSAAMLNFLNNQQNKKNHPNENFAREVMELFTMGRGNYSEKDICESARAFTGWNFDKDGNFLERPKIHDEGVKTFLGRTGNFNGTDILKIILEQKTTAKFITTKIYRFLVNDDIDSSKIESLSQKFYASNYDIKTLLTEIFTSEWFYEQKNIGAKIKSPIELMAGIMRILPVSFENPQNLIVYQKLLGQMLLYPPNVAGWPSGKSWIDSSTLMLRLKIPQIWSGMEPLEVSPKDDDDMDMGMKNPQNIVAKSKNSKITIDWSRVEQIFKNENVEEILLQRRKSLNSNVINDFSNRSLKLRIVDVMSTPEFQLC